MISSDLDLAEVGVVVLTVDRQPWYTVWTDSINPIYHVGGLFNIIINCGLLHFDGYKFVYCSSILSLCVLNVNIWIHPAGIEGKRHFCWRLVYKYLLRRKILPPPPINYLKMCGSNVLSSAIDQTKMRGVAIRRCRQVISQRNGQAQLWSKHQITLRTNWLFVDWRLSDRGDSSRRAGKQGWREHPSVSSSVILSRVSHLGLSPSHGQSGLRTWNSCCPPLPAPTATRARPSSSSHTFTALWLSTDSLSAHTALLERL